MLSAGEASGDNYGAMVISSLCENLRQRSSSGLQAFGLGGEKMRLAGCELIVDAHAVAAVGITEIVTHLPDIYRAYRRLVRALRERRPDALVLIDFPDVNFKLARHAHRLGIPVVFFVSPQLWAWKPWRLRLVRRYVTRMLVIFPFEEPFYRERGVNAEFVGHPLAELPQPSISREAFAAKHGLDARKPWIALLPGSRRGEIALNAPELARAALILDPAAFEFIVPVASTLSDASVGESFGSDAARMHFVPSTDARAAMLHARASIVASGTATVEAALIGNPFVVVYRVSPLTYAIGKRLVRLKSYAMVNLIAGKQIVPELIQDDFTAENVVRHIRPLLDDDAARRHMTDDLAQVRRQLHGKNGPAGGTKLGAIECVAAAVTQVVDRRTT